VETIKITADGPVTVVTICRRSAATAVDAATADALLEAFRAFDADACGLGGHPHRRRRQPSAPGPT